MGDFRQLLGEIASCSIAHATDPRLSCLSFFTVLVCLPAAEQTDNGGIKRSPVDSPILGLNNLKVVQGFGQEDRIFARDFLDSRGQSSGPVPPQDQRPPG
jgi:hypothetical protein